MERRNFLFSLCGIGGAALAASTVAHAEPPPRLRRCKIVNNTTETIYLKIVSAFPDTDSHPERGGVLFPEEFYFDVLGEGKRVVIAWNHSGEKILTMKAVDVM